MVVARLVLDQRVIARAAVSMRICDLAGAREPASAARLVARAPDAPRTQSAIDGALFWAARARLGGGRARLATVVSLACDGAKAGLRATAARDGARLPREGRHDAVHSARLGIAGLDLQLARAFGAAIVGMAQHGTRSLAVPGATRQGARAPLLPRAHLAVDWARRAHAFAQIHERGAVEATVLCLLRNRARAALLAWAASCRAGLPRAPLRDLAVRRRGRGRRLHGAVLGVACLALHQAWASVTLESGLDRHDAAALANTATARLGAVRKRRPRRRGAVHGTAFFVAAARVNAHRARGPVGNRWLQDGSRALLGAAAAHRTAGSPCGPLPDLARERALLNDTVAYLRQAGAVGAAV